MEKYFRFPNFLNKCLTFSYDDGVLTDPKLAQIFQEKGLKATFNLNSGKLSDNHSEFRLSPKEAVQLYSNDLFEVAVHGYAHKDLPKFSDQEVIEDIAEDKKILEAMFNRKIEGMAYSYGTYDDRVVALIEGCGIKYARTVEDTFGFDLPKDWLRLKPTCHHDYEKLFELAEQFLAEQEKPQLFYIWGHSYEFKDNNNWERIEDFATKMANRKDIWYATNMEIYDYCKAYEHLSEVDGKIYNPTSTDLYLNYKGKNLLVGAGKVISVEK